MKSATVLCVDDAENVRKFYRDLFVSHGYEVLSAASGHEALDIFHDRRIDAVILDYKMPGMSGVELADRLKRHDPTLPIVMVSGTVPDEGRIAPCIDVAMVKGVSNRDILQKVEQLLTQRFAASSMRDA